MAAAWKANAHFHRLQIASAEAVPAIRTKQKKRSSENKIHLQTTTSTQKIIAMQTCGKIEICAADM